MQIDVISDFVCPWCFIGKRRFWRALEMRPELEFDVLWRPYRLDPTVPREGFERRSYMKRKFGDSGRMAEMATVLKQEGASEGIDFAFENIERTPNTLDAHRLVRWATQVGLEDSAVERLFSAYFLEGRDIGDPATLEYLAADIGMDSLMVANLLTGDTDLAAVEREAALAGEMGVSGVPTFIFGGKFALSGAREPEIMLRAIDKVLESEETAEPQTVSEG